MRLLKNFLIGLILVLAGISAMLLIPSPQPPASKPWEVINMPDGNSKVFGIHLANTSYKTAQEQLGVFGKTAIFTDPDNSTSVEAYFESINLGGLSAKLVLNLAVPPEQLQAMLKRAKAGKLQPSGAHQHELAQSDRVAVLKAPVTAITYIPSVSLDKQMIASRFGDPDATKTMTDSEGVSTTIWHYAAPNLRVHFSENQKTLLLYTAKSMFPDQVDD